MEPAVAHVSIPSNSYERVIIIGDVHGCHDEFEKILKSVEFRKDIDLLILVGDLLGKGPQSVATVRTVIRLGALCVRGNHEDNLIRSLRDPGGKHFIKRYPFGKDLSKQEVDWIINLPYTITLPDAGLVVVHAGLVPGLPVHRQRPKDLMRMRTIDAQGRGSKEHASKDFTSWASVYPGPQTVVFGHTARQNLQVHPFAIGLDTGCVHGRQLTALVVDQNGKRFVHVDAAKIYEEPETSTEL